MEDSSTTRAKAQTKPSTTSSTTSSSSSSLSSSSSSCSQRDVSLVCQFSKKRIQSAARTRNCDDHLEAFDEKVRKFGYMLYKDS